MWTPRDTVPSRVAGSVVGDKLSSDTTEHSVSTIFARWVMEVGSEKRAFPAMPHTIRAPEVLPPDRATYRKLLAHEPGSLPLEKKRPALRVALRPDGALLPHAVGLYDCSLIVEIMEMEERRTQMSVIEEQSEQGEGYNVPVSPSAIAARTRHLQIACSTIALIVVLSVGVTLGVTQSTTQREPGTAVKTSVIGDQVPLVIYQRWSGPGCSSTEGLKHQAAYAPGDCISLLDNGFGGPENRRFMYECSSIGDIIYKEWRASRRCAGTPDKTENRTQLQNCVQNEQTKEWERLSCGMQIESAPGQAITRHGCGQGGGVGGGGGQGQSGGASRGRTIPLEFCIAYAGVSAMWSCLHKPGDGELKSGDQTIVYQPFSGHDCSHKVSCPDRSIASFISPTLLRIARSGEVGVLYCFNPSFLERKIIETMRRLSQLTPRACSTRQSGEAIHLSTSAGCKRDFKLADGEMVNVKLLYSTCAGD